ncbi:MAG: 4-alpha-glucanotransferase [Actinomycetota bacterium]
MTLKSQSPQSASSGVADHAAPQRIPEEVSDQLAQLATAYGIATEYTGIDGERTPVSPATIDAVLRCWGVRVENDEEAREALADKDLQEWSTLLPPVLVTRQGSSAEVILHPPVGSAITVWAELADGSRRDLPVAIRKSKTKNIAGRKIGYAVSTLPDDVPIGWHRLHAEVNAAGHLPDQSANEESPGADERQGEHDFAAMDSGLNSAEHLSVQSVCDWAVAPTKTSASDHENQWGAMTTVPALRSRRSWGTGDFEDVAEVTVCLAVEGNAQWLAVDTALPGGVSNDAPRGVGLVSCQFGDPTQIRVEAIAEVADMPGTQRQLLEWQSDAVNDHLDASGVSADQTALWQAKRAALDLVFHAPRSRARQHEFDAYRAAGGATLDTFATWCALVEEHNDSWHDWAEHFPQADQQRFVIERERLAARVEFYQWCQWVQHQQIAAAHSRARAAGMSVGLLRDFPSGVHPEAADAWRLGDMVAHGFTEGTPPTANAPEGHSDGPVPWHPGRLAAVGYQPYRDAVRAAVATSGGLRIPEESLTRGWWIPRGRPASEGTWVSYDREVLAGIIAVEVHLAGAVSLPLRDDASPQQTAPLAPPGVVVRLENLAIETIRPSTAQTIAITDDLQPELVAPGPEHPGSP